MNINKILKKVAVLALPLTLGVGTGTFTSCADMLDTKSEMVEFTEDNQLNTPQDTLYSVMGIIRSMQTIADRTVLLGELRGDLMVTTDKASTSLKNLAAFNLEEENDYNRIADYYAVINNCNYFIANADTSLMKLQEHIFKKEYAAVKTFRAWTYLQLAKIYGEVPLVLDPVLTENQAQAEKNKKYSGIQEICNYFIDDIKPFVDTDLPMYGEMGGFNSTKFFIPVRVLLGEMCLWANRYQEAAEYFHEYLTFKNREQTTGKSYSRWQVGSDLNFSTAGWSSSYTTAISNSRSVENITIIPLETSEFYGKKGMLENVYNSTEYNYYYFQAKPSQGMFDLSAAQDYCYLNKITEINMDTIYVPKTDLRRPFYAGDLRLASVYSFNTYNRDETSNYNGEHQTISKFSETFIPLYRIQQVYLMFAEALNRAGYPETAFCILKYGLYDMQIKRDLKNGGISQQERERAGNLIKFTDDVFKDINTQGIHARGCGDVTCDSTYCLPMPETALASYNDTVQYQIPLLEDMIVTEMALESAFEGKRYYDLMRIALRRNDASYLATPIARRNGTEDAALKALLMDKKNWYLPIK